MITVYAQVLLLILTANGLPIVARVIMKEQWQRPLDGGRTFLDGRPILGKSKTYRGIVVSSAGSMGMAVFLGLSWEIGLTIGGLAMAGDCFSSFLKRRMGYDSGAIVFGLDQIPESFFPLLGVWSVLSLSVMGMLATVGVFMVLDLILSPFLFKLGIREQPF